MLSWFQDLDRVLRGESTRLSTLRAGSLEVSAQRLSVVILALAVFYGVCMGSYAVFRPGGPVFVQMVATAVKVPALFFLTLLVTFPSLYVSNALVGSRLSLLALLRLLIASLAVNVTVLASLGTIVAFFSVTTTSYPFMVLLNVAVFAVAGMMGVAFLLQTLHRLTLATQPPPEPLLPAEPIEAPPEAPTSDEPLSNGAIIEAQLAGDPGALQRPDNRVISERVKVIVRCWIVVFALVGAQMGWVLRPLVGAPTVDFHWFRPRGSNFFEAVWNSFASLFS
ncbi:MAG: hypothetical protein A2V98_16525 [Planctomycetes bacterium RBG_16_64_12]|nr:MAG: hypothetical protein A2V98_16525 [Planctomycetes bacterium RBG_16_64_12]